MARYEEMDDLLRRVRGRLTDVPDSTGDPDVALNRTFEAVMHDDRYDQVEACLQGLMDNAEGLRELLASDGLTSLSHPQHKHVLSILNSILQELWSSEVSLRRAALSD